MAELALLDSGELKRRMDDNTRHLEVAKKAKKEADQVLQSFCQQNKELEQELVYRKLLTLVSGAEAECDQRSAQLLRLTRAVVTLLEHQGYDKEYVKAELLGPTGGEWSVCLTGDAMAPFTILTDGTLIRYNTRISNLLTDHPREWFK